MRYSPFALLLILAFSLMVESCAVAKGGWRSDRGAIGGALRDSSIEESID